MTMNEQTQRMLTRRHFGMCAGGLCVAALFGCSVPGSGPPARRIRLTAAKRFPPKLPSVAWTLRVNEPTAQLSLNTAKIAYIAADKRIEQIEYMADAEWASRAPEMVMELLVRSFKNSNSILEVGDRSARIRPNFELETRLTNFEITETATDAGRVRVALETSLVKRPQRSAVATSSFDSESKVAPLSLDNIVSAFDQSLRDVMKQVVEWTLVTGSNA